MAIMNVRTVVTTRTEPEDTTEVSLHCANLEACLEGINVRRGVTSARSSATQVSAIQGNANPVAKVEVEERTLSVPKINVQVSDRLLEVNRVQYVQKTIEVPEIRIIDRIVEVPQVKIQEVLKAVPRVTVCEIVHHVPKIEVQEVVRTVPKYVDQVVEKIVEVPTIQTVEKIVEVPEIKTVEVFVDVPHIQVVEMEKRVHVSALSATTSLEAPQGKPEVLEESLSSRIAAARTQPLSSAGSLNTAGYRSGQSFVTPREKVAVPGSVTLSGARVATGPLPAAQGFSSPSRYSGRSAGSTSLPVAQGRH